MSKNTTNLTKPKQYINEEDQLLAAIDRAQEDLGVPRTAAGIKPALDLSTFPDTPKEQPKKVLQTEEPTSDKAEPIKSTEIQNLQSAEFRETVKRAEEQTAVVEGLKSEYSAATTELYAVIERREFIRQELHRAMKLRDSTTVTAKIIKSIMSD